METLRTTNTSALLSAMNPTVSACVDHGALQVPLAVLYSVIFILGLAGNVVALWVFLCVPSKNNSVRVFLMNAAFADLLLVACLPFRMLYHSQGNFWNLHPTLCTAVGTLFYMNMYISVTLLGLISVDRYLKMHCGAGTRLQLWSVRCSRLLCTLIWILSFSVASVFLMSRSDSQDPNRCFHYRQLPGAEWKAYINIGLLVVFWLVFVSLVVSYGKIALKLVRMSREKPDLPNAVRYARTAKKSFIVLFLFTVCFVPYHVVRAFYIKTQITPDTPCYWRGVVDQANEVALLLSALNSCLDPVMYFLLSSAVRKQVLRLVASVTCGQHVGASVSSSSVQCEERRVRTPRGLTNSSDTRPTPSTTT